MNQYESFKLEFMLRIIDQGMPQEYSDMASRELDFVAKAKAGKLRYFCENCQE